MITTALVLLLLGLLIFYVFTKEGRPQNFPPVSAGAPNVYHNNRNTYDRTAVLSNLHLPDNLTEIPLLISGPFWWPFIGNGFMLRNLSKKLKGQHLALSKLAKDFNTSVLGLKLGKSLVVVTLSLEANRAVLTRDVFTGRPISFFMKLRCFGKIQGITSTDGYLWREQRAFTVKHLKQFGFGKEVMDHLIMDEVKELVEFLREEKEVESIGNLTAPSILNVLWALATGQRVEKTNPKLKKLLKLLNCRSRAFDMAGGILNQVPWLRFIAPDKTGFSLLQELNSKLKSFLMETVEEQRKTFDPAQTRNLIDAFFHEQTLKQKNFSEDELVVLLLDLFLGGAQTTSQTLDFAFLLMIMNPDVQKKVHDDIIKNVGRDRLPTVEDKSKLVYTEAVLLEVLRIFCVVPIIGPRRSLEDATLNGYSIPKNTTILLNLYTVHHDESLFPDPQKFRPERFISLDGQKLINQENVLTFGLGKRRCLGEALAKSCLFLIFAGVMQNFEITKTSNDEPSLEPLLGLTLAPRPYSAKFRFL